MTVLTGPNNSGKSAVVEALRSVAQNPPPHHVIRHGATQAVVRVELDSGEAVEWVRSKSNPIYRLFQAAQDGAAAGEEPEVYAKFGRTPPDDVRRTCCGWIWWRRKAAPWIFTSATNATPSSSWIRPARRLPVLCRLDGSRISVAHPAGVEDQDRSGSQQTQGTASGMR